MDNEKLSEVTFLFSFDFTKHILILQNTYPLPNRYPAMQAQKDQMFVAWKTSTYATWPEFDEALAKDDLITMAIQVMGKTRGTIDVPADIDKNEFLSLAKEKPIGHLHDY